MLCNLAYGPDEDVKYLFKPKFEILPNLNRLLQSKDYFMIETIIWFFANCMGESKPVRDLVISQTDLLMVMANTLQQNRMLPMSLVKTILWCNGNIVRSKYLSNIKKQVYFIASSGLNFEDDDLNYEALMSLSTIGDGNGDDEEEC